MTAILSFLLSPVGRCVAIGLVVLTALGGVYIKGRSDGKASYQAKVEREIKRAVDRGEKARADALRKFDSNKEIEDDEFMRRD